MGILFLYVHLLAFKLEEEVDVAAFVDSLDIQKDKGNNEIHLSSFGNGITFFYAELDDFHGEENRDELLEKECASRLLNIASWINRKRATLIDLSRNQELTIILELSLEDEFDFTIPLEFVIACGEAKLKIRLNGF